MMFLPRRLSSETSLPASSGSENLGALLPTESGSDQSHESKDESPFAFNRPRLYPLGNPEVKDPERASEQVIQKDAKEIDFEPFHGPATFWFMAREESGLPNLGDLLNRDNLGDVSHCEWDHPSSAHSPLSRCRPRPRSSLR